MNLTQDEINNLKSQHQKERDKRICDRIKAVLLINSGYNYEQVAKILLVDEDTVRRHIKEFLASEKLADNYKNKNHQNIKLGINIDHIATLRNARKHHIYPNLLHGALIAEEYGADFITIHLREDRRHVIDSDLDILLKNIATYINLEIANTDEMVNIAIRSKKFSNKLYSVCLVPENRQEITTEGGLDLLKINKEHLLKQFYQLISQNIKVTLFLDPDTTMINTFFALANQTLQSLSLNNLNNYFSIEFNTGQFANSFFNNHFSEEYTEIYHNNIRHNQIINPNNIIDESHKQEDQMHSTQTHTHRFTNAQYKNYINAMNSKRIKASKATQIELQKLAISAKYAHQLGFNTHIGHGLDYWNISLILDQMTDISAINIGYAVIVEGLLAGLGGAVGAMKQMIANKN